MNKSYAWQSGYIPELALTQNHQLYSGNYSNSYNKNEVMMYKPNKVEPSKNKYYDENKRSKSSSRNKYYDKNKRSRSSSRNRYTTHNYTENYDRK